MRKIFLILLMVVFTRLAFGADAKISALTNLATLPADADDFVIYDQDAGATKRVGFDVVVGQDVSPDAAPTFESIQLNDDTTVAYDLILDSVGDGGTAMAADRTLSFDVYNANRSIDLQGNIDLAGNLTTAAAVTHTGSALTVAVEDAASTITLDEQNFEVEGEGTASRLFKLINSVDEARTLTFGDNLTITAGETITLEAQDAAGSIVLDEQTFEVEGEGTASRLFKLVNAEDAARTLTYNEDFTIGDGNAGTLTFSAASKTATVEDDAVISQDYSADAAPTFEALHINDDTTAAYDLIIDSVGDNGTPYAADRTLSIDVYNANRSLDLAGNLVLSNDFTVGTTNGGTLDFTGASKTLNVEDTATVDQDLTQDATPTFAGVTVSGAATVTMNSLVKHSYDAELADDAEATIATGQAGFGFAMAGDAEEYCQFTFQADGTVTEIAGSTNCETTDSDTDFCVYDCGAGICIKNRLGSAKQVKFTVFY